MTTPYGAIALADELGKIRAAVEGARNTTLNTSWFKLCQLIAEEHLDRDDAAAQVRRAALDTGLPPGEVDKTMASAERGGTAKSRTNIPAPTTSPAPTQPVDVAPSTPAAGLSAAFWQARPPLAQIRQAAWSRGRSAEAVLGAVLARLAADTPYIVKLPPLVATRCGLSLIVALTGPPGTGKSSSKAIACELVPARVLEEACDDVPPGSGEGLIETMFDLETEEDENGKQRRVKRLRRHNVFCYADEGEVLAVQARRSTGNTILPVLRSLFTDGTLGQANAAEERKRRVPGGHYSFGVVLGIQPGKVAPLLDDAGGGTPQRFLWMPTDTPVPAPADRPLWPDEPFDRKDPPPLRDTGWDRSGWVHLGVPAEIADEVAANDHHRQQHGCDPLDEHTDLIRLKTAGLLAVLDGRYDITVDDWHLAEVITDLSRATRDRAIADVAAQRAEENRRRGEAEGRRAAIAGDEVAEHVIQRVSRWAAGKLADIGDWVAWNDLYRKCAHRDRKHLREALDRGVRAGAVTMKEEGKDAWYRVDPRS